MHNAAEIRYLPSWIIPLRKKVRVSNIQHRLSFGLLLLPDLSENIRRTQRSLLLQTTKGGKLSSGSKAKLSSRNA